MKDLTLSPQQSLLDLSTAEQIDNSSSKNNVITIYKEIKKETEVNNIQETGTKSFKKVVQQVRPFLSLYKKTKQKFENLKKNKTQYQRIWTNYPSPFNHKDRESLVKVYEANDELFDKKQELISELRRSADNDPGITVSIISGRQKRNTVTSELSRTGWLSQDYDHIDFKGKWSNKPAKSNHYGWKNWNLNPFRHFFNKDLDFFKLVEGVEAAEHNLNSYMNSRKATALFAMIVGEAGQRSATAQKPKLLQDVANAKLEIYLAIIEKLMLWMGQN